MKLTKTIALTGALLTFASIGAISVSATSGVIGSSTGTWYYGDDGNSAYSSYQMLYEGHQAFLQDLATGAGHTQSANAGTLAFVGIINTGNARVLVGAQNGGYTVYSKTITP